MSEDAIAKWDKAAAFLDFQARGEHLRYGVFKRSLFSRARGKTLLVAAGTGIDFKYFPEGIDLTAIDFSPRMLERAALKADELKGTLTLKEADVTNLDFADGTFDTVVTSCTFCSVPEPVKGLEEVRRVLKDDGRLLMFEHVRSATWYFGVMMDLMNPVSSMLGPNINRRTADNVRKAGFRLTREYNVYLDMVKLFEAVKGTQSPS
jgi:ubiquinone/menaquinone biosynthesis C-methylase UbiE